MNRIKLAGLIVLITGIIFMVIAFADFVNAFSNPFSTPPTKFGLLFIGLPFVFIGFTMAFDGLKDEVVKYEVDESTPVALKVVKKYKFCSKCGDQTDEVDHFCDDCKEVV